MAIAGAAAGAARSLEAIMAEQMLQAKLAQQQAMEQARLQLDQRQLEGIETDREQNRAAQRATVELNQRKFDVEQADAATDRNIGLDAANVLNMPGMSDEAKANEFRQSALRNPGASSAPGMLKMVEGLTKKPTRYPVTTNVNGKPVRKLATEEELASGIEEFHEPKQGPAPEFEWVMRGSQPMQIRKGTAQPGDRPYEKPSQKNTGDDLSPIVLDYSRGIIRKIDDLIGRADDPNTPADESRPNRVTATTAGVGGAMQRMAPWNNEAKDVDAELFSLTSELAISALQKMRASSKTGGAVGNVALGEMEIMKNAQAAIRSDQSPTNLRRQLGIIRDSEQRFLDAAQRDTNASDPGLNRGVSIDPATAAAMALIEKARAGRKPQ